ncbi:MAG: hypothetical protein IJG85_02770 [Eubacteriaceae bacterium]|nr:hypothetical protein [Eubacteriaceae bacterium]
MNKNSFSARSVIIYLVISIIMTLLTASFVLESVYHNSDSIAMTPQGIKAVYESCIGALDFSDAAMALQNTTSVQTTTNTQAPGTTAEQAPQTSAQ